MRIPALVLAITALCVVGAHAQVPADTPLPAVTSAAAGGQAPAHDYLAEIRANFTPENRAYSSTRSALGFVDPFYTILVAVLLLFSGLSARMRDIAYDLVKGRYLRVLVYLVMFSAVSFILVLPLAWAGDFALEHRYGLSNQTLGGWFGDQLKAWAIQIIFLGVIPIVSLAYRRIELNPRRWWLWFAFFSLLSVALFYFTFRIARWLVRRFGPSWGFTELHDLASIPLVLAVLNTVVFL